MNGRNTPDSGAYLMAWFVRVAEAWVQRLITKNIDRSQPFDKKEAVEIQ